MADINPERKLFLKSELLRHMETAKTLYEAEQSSSFLKLLSLGMDFRQLEHNNIEPDLKHWNDWLAEDMAEYQAQKDREDRAA